MQTTRMNLKVLLPFQVFAEKTGVTRIIAETREGSFGLLPHRLDCVAALAPGILIYEDEAEGEVAPYHGPDLRTIVPGRVEIVRVCAHIKPEVDQGLFLRLERRFDVAEILTGGSE